MVGSNMKETITIPIEVPEPIIAGIQIADAIVGMFKSFPVNIQGMLIDTIIIQLKVRRKELE